MNSTSIPLGRTQALRQNFESDGTLKIAKENRKFNVWLAARWSKPSQVRSAGFVSYSTLMNVTRPNSRKGGSSKARPNNAQTHRKSAVWLPKIWKTSLGFSRRQTNPFSTMIWAHQPRRSHRQVKWTDRWTYQKFGATVLEEGGRMWDAWILHE
jgi:hypothetical protein